MLLSVVVSKRFRVSWYMWYVLKTAFGPPLAMGQRVTPKARHVRGVTSCSLAIAQCRLDASITLVPDQLTEVQMMIQDVASHVATPLSSASTSALERTELPLGYVVTVEQWIDTMTEQLPPLTQFILPGGSVPSATIHCARTVASAVCVCVCIYVLCCMCVRVFLCVHGF
eukprot:m.252275 g.252275  ORF g.252275 m.252275 type:complete len:170 (-) comp15471_c0_seq4:816-1325(-)